MRKLVAPEFCVMVFTPGGGRRGDPFEPRLVGLEVPMGTGAMRLVEEGCGEFLCPTAGESVIEGATGMGEIVGVSKMARLAIPSQQCFTTINAVKVGRTKIRHICGNCATIQTQAAV